MPRSNAVLRTCVAMCSCILIVVISNYVHLTYLRQQQWPAAVWLLGNVLLLLSTASLVLTLTTPPGKPPQSWVEAANKGRVESGHEAKKELLLPPRARFVRRTGEVVLHLNVFCWWLGTPIGLRNRKYYVLFTIYTTCLTGFAFALDVYDVLSIFCGPDVGRALLSGRRVRRHTLTHARGLVNGTVLGSGSTLFDRAITDADARLGRAYLRSLPIFALLNMIVFKFLIEMAFTQTILAARGRTCIDPHDATYDCGRVRNMQVVFGSRISLWLVPWPGTHSEHDGIHWTRASSQHGTGET
jgi:hypothetical protein